MSTMDYVKDFKSEIAPLVSAGLLRIVEERSDPAHFGDALIVLEGPRVRVRLVADRGQFFADVASGTTPPRWLPLREVLPHLAKTGHRGAGWGPWKTIGEIGQHLRNDFTALEAFLNSGDPALSQIHHAPDT
jgi:hypothetical protein